MTVEEAKNILKNNWKTDIDEWNKHEDDHEEDDDAMIGDLIRETFNNDFYYPQHPNCFIFKFTVFKKGEELEPEEDWGEIAVSKIDGKCQPVIILK